MRVISYVVVLGTLVGCNVNGPEYEEPRAPDSVEVDPAPAPAATPEAAPPKQPVDLALGTGIEMRRPIHDGRLTLIPVVATAKAALASDVKYITLAEGLSQKLVTVTELGDEDWDVDWVRVTNKSQMPLAIIGGELIIDGKQDRVIAEDVVLAANSSKHVPSRCVEEKREEGGVRFNDGHAVVELSLRRTVRYHEQDSIWSHVSFINTRNKLYPYTRTYRHSAALLTKGDALARRTKLIEKLGELEERKQMIGLAVAIDGQLVAFERMATPELYAALEPRLIASYLPNTAGAPKSEIEIEPEQVRAFASRPGKKTAASFVVLRK